MMTGQTFTGIDADKWAAIKQAFWDQARVRVAADQGSGQSHGIEFNWTWVADSSTLFVNITHVPWLLARTGHSESSIMQDFAGWVQKAQSA